MLFWLIENKDQVKTYLNRGYREAFVEIIPYNINSHPINNSISLVYIKPLNSNKGYMFALDHTESFSLSKEDILHVFSKLDKIYVRDKKEFLHYFFIKKLYDLTLKKPFNVTYTTTHYHFYNKFPNKHDINRIIPISKHYEYCDKIFNELKDRTNDKFNTFYNNRATMVFNTLEGMGLRIQEKEFQKHFYKPESNIIYTQYNFKTTTTRPSNHFKKVNFSALDKENGCRRSFIPKNDKFIEFDITAYHPNILAELVGYKFNTTDIHAELAKLYNVDYATSKKTTFQMIYGGVFDKYKHIKFFSRVSEYTDKIWEEFNEKGYVECDKTGYRFEKDKLMDMNPSKLLNYMIQHRETTLNVNLMWDMFKILRDKKTELILYVYDSFLFDFDETEEEILDQIKELFNINNVSVKEKQGYNYHDLKIVTDIYNKQ